MRSHGDTNHRAPVGPYGNVLSQRLQGRDTRIVALKSDIENGHYSVEPEQVAEKILENSSWLYSNVKRGADMPKLICQVCLASTPFLRFLVQF